MSDSSKSRHLALVRGAVRDLLLSSEAFERLSPAERKELAASMVQVCQRAAEWLEEELTSDLEYRHGGQRATPEQVSVAQASFGEAARRVASTTEDVLTAVSFPRFVTELINGVFKAMVDSSQQQMHSFVELLRNVSATTDGFADANLGPSRSRAWLAEKYPQAFEIVTEEGWDDETPGESRLQLRSGAEWPPEGALRTDLGLAPDESVSRGDPETTLVPLARRALARQRQQMLASMVLMGLQRIVIESGRIHASMRFHVDTRSALAEDRGSSFDLRNTVEAAGKFGMGPWGASASVQNTIGYVSTQQTQSTEELNTELDLNSSVEVVFKTDHVPLEVLAGKEARDRIKVNTLNPSAELAAYRGESAERRKASVASEAARRQQLQKNLQPPAQHKKIRPEVPEPMPAATKTPQAGKPAPPQPGIAKPGAAEPQVATQAGLATGLGELPDRAGETERHPDVVWVPTPLPAVKAMLELAQVRPEETLYDLGCGDGRIVITAAQKYGCRAVGIDIDPRRVADARHYVERARVSDKVRILHRDLLAVDLSQADVVTLYLLPEMNERLLPHLRRMKPGARIVSHDFLLPDISPDKAIQLYTPEDGSIRTLYLWRTPLKPSRAEAYQPSGTVVAA